MDEISRTRSLLEKHAEKTSRLSYLHQERLSQTMRMFRKIQMGGAPDPEMWTAGSLFARYRADKEKEDLLALLDEASTRLVKAEDGIIKNTKTIEDTQATLEATNDRVVRTAEAVSQVERTAVQLGEDMGATQMSLATTKRQLAETLETVEDHQSAITAIQESATKLSEDIEALRKRLDEWKATGSPASTSPALTGELDAVKQAITDFQKFQADVMTRLQGLDGKVDETSNAAKAAQAEAELVKSWSNDLLFKYLTLRREVLGNNLFGLEDIKEWIPFDFWLTEVGVAAGSPLVKFSKDLIQLGQDWETAKNGYKTIYDKYKDSEIPGGKDVHDELTASAKSLARVGALIQDSRLITFWPYLAKYHTFIDRLQTKGYMSSKNQAKQASLQTPEVVKNIVQLFEGVLTATKGFDDADYRRWLNSIP